MLPKNLLRKARLAHFLLFPGAFKGLLRASINGVFRKRIASRFLKNIDAETLVPWQSVELRLLSPVSNPGHTSKFELMIILAMLRKYVNESTLGSAALEIGTFDGNTALNASLNIPPTSMFYTIDLPEEVSDLDGSALPYDRDLVVSGARRRKKHLTQSNVRQIYSDSRRFDFASIKFNFAFIDGAHDAATVRSDSENVLTHIERPGCILWHDYDVENEVGEVLHALSSKHPIGWIEGTRLAVLELDRK